MTLETLEEALKIKEELDVVDDTIRNLEKAADRFTHSNDGERLYEMDSIVKGIHEGRVIISAKTAAKAITDEIAHEKGKRASPVSRLVKM